MVRKLWFCIPLLWLTLATGAAQTETVIVRPKVIDEVLVNPGMGIQTFQRFNGQAVNAGLKWSEEGPTARLREETRPPDFPASSLAYCRWFWEELEPEHGKVRWEIIDQALEEARTHGQTLDIRLMPYDQGHPLPEWYRNSGARRANRPTDHDGAIWQPDFADPIYLKYWGELVAAAGARYDGHPYLDSVDVSSVGYWGEGWSDYMPAFPYQKALIQAYPAADELRPRTGTRLWHAAGRWLAARLLGRHAGHDRRPLVPHAGLLPAAACAGGHSGHLAAKSRLPGDLLGPWVLEAAGVGRELHSRAGPALARLLC
jgi:hypothetical protein